MTDKLFFKGKGLKKPKHVSHSFKTSRTTRPGSKDAPLALTVTSDDRRAEVEALLKEHDLLANIKLDADGQEDISELDCLINKPQTLIVEKTPKRNDPCSCGSGKKYKKCCG